MPGWGSHSARLLSLFVRKTRRVQLRFRMLWWISGVGACLCFDFGAFQHHVTLEEVTRQTYRNDLVAQNI